MEDAGLKYHATTTTWRSYGLHGDAREHRESTIDHVYTAGMHANVRVLADTSSDHRPIVTNISSSSMVNRGKLMTLTRQNYKKLDGHKWETALSNACNWSKIYAIGNVDKSLEFLEAAIVSALDKAALLREITVRKGSPVSRPRHP